MTRDADDLRALRKRLLVAESMLMRERLAQELRDSTRPFRLLRSSLGTASTSMPARSLLLTVVPWLYARWRAKRPSKR